MMRILLFVGGGIAFLYCTCFTNFIASLNSINAKIGYITPAILIYLGIFTLMMDMVASCGDDDWTAVGYMFVILGIISGVAWNLKI